MELIYSTDLEDYQTLVEWLVYESDDGRILAKKTGVSLVLLVVGLFALCFWLFDPVSAFIVAIIFVFGITARCGGLNWGVGSLKIKMMKLAAKDDGLTKNRKRIVCFNFYNTQNVRVLQDESIIYEGAVNLLEFTSYRGRVITKSKDSSFFSVFPTDDKFLEIMTALGGNPLPDTKSKKPQ